MSSIVVLRPDTEPAPLAQAELATRSELGPLPVIGLVDNGKGLARDLLALVAEEIGRRLSRRVEVIFVTKPSPSYALSDDEASELAGSCDVVIAGLGDCGACSSCSVHDAIKVEAAGTPATVLITEPFQGIVASNAAKLGLPGYQVLTVPHPVWGKREDELRLLALQVVDAAISHLTPNLGSDAASPVHAEAGERSR